MIWWWLLIPVILISGLAALIVRMGKPIEFPSYRPHGHYLQGQPFTLMSRGQLLIGNCEVCNAYFRIPPNDWKYQLVAGQVCEVDSLDDTDQCIVPNTTKIL